MVVDLALAYALLVFGAGTAIGTGNPVAIEAGELIQTVLFVEPVIEWASINDLPTMASGGRWLASGFDFAAVL